MLLCFCSCVSKPKNTTCVDYDMYLNYTINVEDLLQLEYEAMNYIEANVTNQYCRNYLKGALCITIYPPCNGSIIQKLCSEECDHLLNDGACSSGVKHFIDYVNSLSNLFENFTINCSNSLSFSNNFIDTMPCQSNGCVSLIKTTEIPAR